MLKKTSLLSALALLLLLFDDGGQIGEDRVVDADERAEAAISLLENAGVLEVAGELGGPLDAGEANVANFARVELLPLLVVELEVEVLDELGVDEVDEGVAHVALVLRRSRAYLEVDGQVEEVDLLLVVLVEKL